MMRKTITTLGAIALLIGALFALRLATASASPTGGALCGDVEAGSTSAWCALRASGTTPSDTRANGQVTLSSDGTTLTVNTEDNAQGNQTLGAAPYSSEACIYPPPQQPREARLDDPAKCSAAGGTLVSWLQTNSSGSIPVPAALVGKDFFVYVAAHPSATDNAHGTAFHGTFEVNGATQVPLGTVGGIGAAVVAGGALGYVQIRRQRRNRLQATGA